MIDFPASPTNGQVFASGGQSWTYDGTKWVALGVGVMPIGDNRIINGDMRIDQRNNGASGTAQNVYTVDRWKFSSNVAGQVTWGRNVVGGIGPAGFPYCLGGVSNSAHASAAGDIVQFFQIIEAEAISDFQWGTGGAQSVTLSFWTASSLTGTFSGRVGDPAGGRSYPFTYSIPVANTWTKVVLTIPGDTSGTWTTSGNAGGVIVSFDLGSGSTNRGPANAWANGGFCGANGAVSIVSTLNAYLNITGVKLEIGSVATPFNRQSLAKSMADCQRYYQAGNFALQGQAGASAMTVGYQQTLAVVMRAAPTTTIPSETTNTGMGARSVIADSASHIRPSGLAANAFTWTGVFTASAEL